MRKIFLLSSTAMLALAACDRTKPVDDGVIAVPNNVEYSDPTIVHEPEGKTRLPDKTAPQPQ